MDRSAKRFRFCRIRPKFLEFFCDPNKFWVTTIIHLVVVWRRLWYSSMKKLEFSTSVGALIVHLEIEPDIYSLMFLCFSISAAATSSFFCKVFFWLGNATSISKKRNSRIESAFFLVSWTLLLLLQMFS